MKKIVLIASVVVLLSAILLIRLSSRTVLTIQPTNFSLRVDSTDPASWTHTLTFDIKNNLSKSLAVSVALEAQQAQAPPSRSPEGGEELAIYDRCFDLRGTTLCAPLKREILEPGAKFYALSPTFNAVNVVYSQSLLEVPAKISQPFFVTISFFFLENYALEKDIFLLDLVLTIQKAQEEKKTIRIPVQVDVRYLPRPQVMESKN